ncbi:hypothetical protein [Sciscionella marina]|uniref:hypothetical protein n=1 Tax=Sciscionella marina TaxID=508770 RepID=UPI00036D3182|nr:hypothetical protein [Sciscionella marina]
MARAEGFMVVTTVCIVLVSGGLWHLGTVLTGEGTLLAWLAAGLVGAHGALMIAWGSTFVFRVQRAKLRVALRDNRRDLFFGIPIAGLGWAGLLKDYVHGWYFVGSALLFVVAGAAAWYLYVLPIPAIVNRFYDDFFASRITPERRAARRQYMRHQFGIGHDKTTKVGRRARRQARRSERAAMRRRISKYKTSNRCGSGGC